MFWGAAARTGVGCVRALPTGCRSGKPRPSVAMLDAGHAGKRRAAAALGEPADITPGSGGSRWDIAMALPTAKLNIKHLAEGSGVLAAQEVCHGDMAK